MKVDKKKYASLLYYAWCKLPYNNIDSLGSILLISDIYKRMNHNTNIEHIAGKKITGFYADCMVDLFLIDKILNDYGFTYNFVMTQ